MKFILLMQTGSNMNFPPMHTWPADDIKGHIRFMMGFSKGLRDSGELVVSEWLSWPGEAVLVRADAEGKPSLSSAFPAGKEYLMGLWIINVPTKERAYEIAAQASAAPGPGGAPVNMAIEVRQIPGGPPPEFLA